MLAFNTRSSSMHKSRSASALAVAGSAMARGPSPIPFDPPGLFVSAPSAHKTREKPPVQHHHHHHKPHSRSLGPPASLAASPGSESTQSTATTAPTSVAYEGGTQGERKDPADDAEPPPSKGPSERRIRFREEQDYPSSPQQSKAAAAPMPDGAGSRPGTPQMITTGGFDFAANQGAPFSDHDQGPPEDVERWEALQEDLSTEQRWRSRRLDSAPPRSRSTSRGDSTRGTGLGLGSIPSNNSTKGLPFARFHTRQLSSLTEDSFLVDRSDRGSAMGAFEPAWADDMSNVDPGGSMRSSPSCADSGTAPSVFATAATGSGSAENQKRASSQLSRLWTHRRGSSTSTTNTEHRDPDERERGGGRTPDVEPSSSGDAGAYEVAALKRQVEQLQLLLTKRSAYGPDGEDSPNPSRPRQHPLARPSIGGASATGSAAEHNDVAMLAAKVASLEEMFRRNATALPPLPNAPPRRSTSGSRPTRTGSAANFRPLEGPASSYMRSASPSAFGDIARSTTPSVIGPDVYGHPAEAGYYAPSIAPSRRSFSLSHPDPVPYGVGAGPERFHSPYVTGLHGHTHRSHHHLPSQQQRPWSPAPIASPSAASQPAVYPASVYPYNDGPAAASSISFAPDGGSRVSTSTRDSGSGSGSVSASAKGKAPGPAGSYRPLQRIESSSTISTQHNFTFNATPPALSGGTRNGEPPPTNANGNGGNAAAPAVLPTSPATALRKLDLPAHTDIFLDERHRPVVWHEATGQFVPLDELLGARNATANARKTSFALPGPPHGDAGPGSEQAGFTPFGAYAAQRQMQYEQNQYHAHQQLPYRQQYHPEHPPQPASGTGLERSTSTNAPSTWSGSSGGGGGGERAPSLKSPTGSTPGRSSVSGKGHGTGGGGLHSKSLAGLLVISKSKKQELRAREEELSGAEGGWGEGGGQGPGTTTPGKTKVKVVGPGRGRMVVKK